MSERVKKILNEVSTKNFPKLSDIISDEVKKGSYDSIQREQLKIRAEKLRDFAIEEVLSRAKDCKISWDDFLLEDECRGNVTKKLMINLSLLEQSKRVLTVIDELCDKLLANE